MRESRVRKPLLRSAGRSSGLKREIARDKPMRTAPACPPTPPPFAVQTTSTWSRQIRELQRLERRHASTRNSGNTDPAVRPLTVNLPEPARRNTRATDSLRRPVPRIHDSCPRGANQSNSTFLLIQTTQMRTADSQTAKDRHQHVSLPYCTGWHPTRRRKAPQRAEKPVWTERWRLEYRRLLHLLNNNPLNLFATAKLLRTLNGETANSATACGFCPA